MNIFAIALTTYVAIGAVFFVRTFLEGQTHKGGWDIARVTGLLLSPLWPCLIVLIAVATVTCDDAGRLKKPH